MEQEDIIRELENDINIALEPIHLPKGKLYKFEILVTKDGDIITSLMNEDKLTFTEEDYKMLEAYGHSIDEKELDDIALNIYNLNGETPEALKVPEHPNKEIYDWMCKCFNTMIWGIKLGYKKALEYKKAEEE